MKTVDLNPLIATAFDFLLILNKFLSIFLIFCNKKYMSTIVDSMLSIAPENAPKIAPENAPDLTAEPLPVVGIELIKQFTECCLKASPVEDRSGEPVSYRAGWEATCHKDGRPLARGECLTLAQANELLYLYVQQELMPALVQLPNWHLLNENQQGALLSFIHSLGQDRFVLASQLPLSRALRDRYWNKIPGILKRYHGPNPPSNIVRRRQKEAELFSAEIRRDCYLVINRSRLLELSEPRLVGQDVCALQRALIQKGYEISLDGVFGPITQWAVEKFQAAVDLPVNGVADVETQRILHARSLYWSKPYLIGSDVREVQFLLARMGYDVVIDGIFSRRTWLAVIDFQRYLNLSDNGVVEGKTLTWLMYPPVMAKVS
jgi:GH24 family phage-related lysozyme (muramidase)